MTNIQETEGSFKSDSPLSVHFLPALKFTSLRTIQDQGLAGRNNFWCHLASQTLNWRVKGRSR